MKWIHVGVASLTFLILGCGARIGARQDLTPGSDVYDGLYGGPLLQAHTVDELGGSGGPFYAGVELGYMFAQGPDHFLITPRLILHPSIRSNFFLSFEPSLQLGGGNGWAFQPGVCAGWLLPLAGGAAGCARISSDKWWGLEVGLATPPPLPAS